MSLNKVMLLGRLGKDVEFKQLDSGSSVARFSVATGEKYKDKAGNVVEKTEWHNVVVWSKLAELCSEYLHKGSQVFVEGKITTRKWQNKEGQDQYTTEISARSVQFLDPNKDNEEGQLGF